MVALGVVSVMLMGATQLVASQLRTSRRHTANMESQQAIRVSLDTMTRDIRLAGACLPTDGEFIAIEGTDDPRGDTITVRTGIIRDRTCTVTSLNVLAPENTTEVTVASAAGFEPGRLAYVRHPNGGGQILRITAVTATTVTFADALVQDFPIASGLYAIDERTYAIDRTGQEPVLTLTVDDGVPMPFALGMQNIQIGYLLDRDCPACARVDLPLGTVEWRLVRSLDLTATVGTTSTGSPPMMIATSSAKPRNLQP
jgi:type II secretory pathway pseudopilin PulG